MTIKRQKVVYESRLGSTFTTNRLVWRLGVLLAVGTYEHKGMKSVGNLVPVKELLDANLWTHKAVINPTDDIVIVPVDRNGEASINAYNHRDTSHIHGTNGHCYRNYNGPKCHQELVE